jgi:hypothetical protein
MRVTIAVKPGFSNPGFFDEGGQLTLRVRGYHARLMTFEIDDMR